MIVLFLHLSMVKMLLASATDHRTEPPPPPVEVSLLTPSPKPPPPVVPPEPPRLVPKPRSTYIPPKTVPLVAVKSETTDADAPAATPPEPVKTVFKAAPPTPPAEVVAPPQHKSAQIDGSINCSTPQYPPASRRSGETGTVRLLFLVNESGEVVESRVENSSGFARLDEAAKDALSLCHFTPGTVDGRPEKSWTRLDYVWRIR